jgi:WD40 repeat protein
MSGVNVPQSAWSPADPFAGHPGPAWAVAVTPDGRQIVTGGRDGTARLWDRTSGQLQTTLTGHTGWVTAVAVTPDGRQIVTGGDDGAIRVWNRRSGRQVAERLAAADPTNSGWQRDLSVSLDKLGDVARAARYLAAPPREPGATRGFRTGVGNPIPGRRLAGARAGPEDG